MDEMRGNVEVRGLKMTCCVNKHSRTVKETIRNRGREDVPSSCSSVGLSCLIAYLSACASKLTEAANDIAQE